LQPQMKREKEDPPIDFSIPPREMRERARKKGDSFPPCGNGERNAEFPFFAHLYVEGRKKKKEKSAGLPSARGKEKKERADHIHFVHSSSLRQRIKKGRGGKKGKKRPATRIQRDPLRREKKKKKKNWPRINGVSASSDPRYCRSGKLENVDDPAAAPGRRRGGKKKKKKKRRGAV